MKHIWVGSVFDSDSEYVKKSIDFYNSYQKSSVVFQRSSEKPVFRFFLRNYFAYEHMRLGLGYQTVKTAGLYLVPIKRYSKNNRLHWLLERIIDSGTRFSPFEREKETPSNLEYQIFLTSFLSDIRQVFSKKNVFLTSSKLLHETMFSASNIWRIALRNLASSKTYSKNTQPSFNLKYRVGKNVLIGGYCHIFK